MAVLTPKDKAIIEQLFEMSSGYVLDFNNATFKSFIAGLFNIDVYTEQGYVAEPSKGKKLRYFIENESDDKVGTLLLALLDRRDVIITRKQMLSDEYIDKNSKFSDELRNTALKMSGNTSDFSSETERLSSDIQSAKKVLTDLISIGSKLCLNVHYDSSSTEDRMNDYYRDMLTSSGYNEVKDQTRHGISGSGIDAGEVDLLLTKDGNEIAIIEALKLSSVQTENINRHIEKAVINYNALGTPSFIIAYVSSANFHDFWQRYIHYLRNLDFVLDKKCDIQEGVAPYACIRVAHTILSRDGFDFPVYFLALNINT